MASNAFLKIHGVIGPGTSPGHYGEIEIINFYFSPRVQHIQAIQPPTTARHEDTLNVVKKFDNSSARLAQAVAAGEKFPTVSLTMEGAAGGKNAGVRLATYLMTNVVFFDMWPTGVYEGSQTEGVKMQFGKIDVYQVKK